MHPHVLWHLRGIPCQNLSSTEEVGSSSNSNNVTTPPAKESEENEVNSAGQSLLNNDNIVKIAEKDVLDFLFTYLWLSQ